MRFCPDCGAPLMVGASFCVECGHQVAELPPTRASASGQVKAAAKARSVSGFQLTTPFLAVFLGIIIVGLGAAAFVLTRPLPQPGNEATTSDSGSSAKTAQQQTNSGANFPPGHPKVELPTEARTFIDKIDQEAKSKPDDAAAWVKLGTVAMRAALFDPSYYRMATDAYAHVLKLDPDNLDALRGIGDIDYDRQNYDEAIAAYEHYLKKKPNDPEVRTDLGTMYLYTGNADQAVVQYKKAIALKPDLYQPYYNLGVAYGQMGDKSNAAVALTKAIALAPDNRRRDEAKGMLAKVTGIPAEQGATMASSLATPQANPRAASAAKSGSFHSSFEQMVRSLPVAGAKVSSVQWPDKFTAKVMMDNFPMDAMPSLAKNKFLQDLRAGIDSAKAAHNVTDDVEVDLVDAQSGRVMQTVTE